jgi:dTDP-4-amino-4,6-dideoxygalactose transaminase
MQVPFLDLRTAQMEVRKDLKDAAARVIDSGRYVLGPEVAAFEEEYADYVSAKHCVGMSNGLDALRLTLRALGVSMGTAVVTPANTFIATWLAITDCAGEIVPAEPAEDTFNIDGTNVVAHMGTTTRVVLPVHLYGHPAEMTSIMDVARAHHAFVLEDAAQAQGAKHRGQRIGAIGDATAWSFYPAKNLGACGDAGAVTTNDDGLAQELRLLRNYGSTSKYLNDLQGFNARLDELQAAILRVQLTRLEENNARRREIAQRYSEGLADAPIQLPSEAPWATHVWHQYVIRHPSRDGLQKALARLGVETLIHYPVPPHLQKAYAALGYRPGAFPITERIHQQVLSLPIGGHLSDAQVDYTIDAVRRTAAKMAAEE